MSHLYYDQIIEEFESELDGWHDPIDLLGEDVSFSEALEVLRPDSYAVHLAQYISSNFTTLCLGDELVYVWRG